MLHLLAALALSSLLVHLVRRLIIPRRLPHFPCLSTTRWFWGDLPLALESYQQTQQFQVFFEKLYDDFGRKTYQFFFTGDPKAWLVIGDAATVERVLSDGTTWDKTDRVLEVFSTITPKGLLSLPTDAVWRAHRRFLAPAMTPKNLRASTPSIVADARALVSLWSLKVSLLHPSADGCFDVSKDLSFLATDIISSLALGRSFALLEGTTAVIEAEGVRKEGQPFSVATSELGDATSTLFAAFPFQSAFPSLSIRIRRATDPAFRRIESTVNTFVREKVEASKARIQAGEAEICLLDNILKKEFEDGGVTMDPNDLRDELLLFFIAGEETTASTMSWVLLHLSQHPDVQHRLHRELFTALGGEEISYDIVSRTPPYLEAVINEVLRVSGTVSFTNRKALRETEIDGQPIAKGTQVYLLFRAMSLQSSALGDKGYGWSGDDVSKFRPERWLDANGNFNAKAGPNVPFSLGPRACYGVRLAMLELLVATALISQSFFLEALPEHLADPHETRVKEMITRRPIETWIKPRDW